MLKKGGDGQSTKGRSTGVMTGPSLATAGEAEKITLAPYRGVCRG